MSETQQQAAAGWYDDGTGRQRWWDGTAWGPFSPSPSIVVQQAAPKIPVSGSAVAGFVIALIGFLGCLIPGFGLIVGGVGAILAGGGLYETHRNGKSGRGLASAGIILGVLAAFITVMIYVVLAASRTS